jgi:hypothetical protein
MLAASVGVATNASVGVATNASVAREKRPMRFPTGLFVCGAINTCWPALGEYS